MEFNEHFSARRSMAVVVGLMLAVLLVPAGVEAAAPTLMRLVDADSTNMAQVDNGKLRVWDGNGAMTVNGAVNVPNGVTVTQRPSTLLRRGYCWSGNTPSTTLEPGWVITDIFLTGSVDQYPGARLDIYEGTKPAGTTIDENNKAIMSLKNYSPSGDIQASNVMYSSPTGFRVTGTTPWAVECSGHIKSAGTNGALFAFFGHDTTP